MFKTNTKRSRQKEDSSQASDDERNPSPLAVVGVKRKPAWTDKSLSSNKKSSDQSSNMN